MKDFSRMITTDACAVKSKETVLYVFTIIYLSLLAFERIDLLHNDGSFSFTLELLGSIIILLGCFGKVIIDKGKLQFSMQLKEYAKLLLAFMATVLLSVFFSYDFEQSVRRIVLLSVHAFAGLFSVNYLITQHSDRITSMVVNGMVFLSIVYVICSVYDVIVWFSPEIALKISSVFPYFKDNISTIGITFVRARGASGDPNRAGIFMIINAYIILQYCKKPILKIVICTLDFIVLLLTLSRTSYLCLVLFILLQMIVTKKIKLKKKYLFRAIVVVVILALIIVGLYQIPFLQEAVNHTFNRLQNSDASADEHILFLREGLKTAFTNLKILFLGNGYGVSDNILGNGKYSNFHNAFISFLVECGMFSLFFFVLLLLYPLQKNKLIFPIVVVLIFANIPYQIYVEPYFWFLIPFLCITPKLQNTALNPQKTEGE